MSIDMKEITERIEELDLNISLRSKICDYENFRLEAVKKEKAKYISDKLEEILSSAISLVGANYEFEDSIDESYSYLVESKRDVENYVLNDKGFKVTYMT